jgi:hypothetical protein
VRAPLAAEFAQSRRSSAANLIFMNLGYSPSATTCSEILPNGNTAHYIVDGGTFYRAKLQFRDGTADPRATHPAVIAVLERARTARATAPLVRIFYGDPGGVSSLATCNTVGRVGRALGRTKIPLLTSDRDRFGAAISTERVVRIDSQRRTLWHHPGFRLPELNPAVGDDPAFPYELRNAAGTCVARFDSESQRQRWLSVMAGDVFPDPVLEASAWGRD